MTVLRVVRRGSASEMAREHRAWREPRCDIVAERAVGEDRFEAEGGPFRHYERRLSMTELGPEDSDDHEGGSWQLVETTAYRLAVPVWAWLFHFPVKHALRRRREVYGYWWAPPDRIDARASTVLGLLCTVQVLDGYLGTVLSQTLTFAADEFGHGNTAQGIVLAVVRVGVLVALASVALADRHGRRRLLLATGTASCVVTALGALSPGLWFLGGTQLLARGLSTALGILIVVLAAEEMPARSRAWAMSVLVLCAGLGSGMAVWVLPVADQGAGQLLRRGDHRAGHRQGACSPSPSRVGGDSNSAGGWPPAGWSWSATCGRLFLRFNGGRAAATALGATGAFLPWQFGITFVVGGLTYLATRNASLGILLVGAPLPLLTVALGEPIEAIIFCFAAPISAALKTVWDKWRLAGTS